MASHIYNVSWSAPPVDVTSVIVQVDDGTGFLDYNSVLPSPSVKAVTITAAVGAVIRFQVLFVNAQGRGAPSNIVTVTMPNVPAAPVISVA